MDDTAGALGDDTSDRSTSSARNRNQSVSSIEKLLGTHGLTATMARFMDENLLNEEIDDLDNATKEQICTYIGEYLITYRNKFYDEELLREFRKDFNGWEFKQFNKAGAFKKDFRTLFEYQGVKVPDISNDATAMVALLKGHDKGEEIEDWDEDEIKERIATNKFHPRAMMRYRILSSTTKVSPVRRQTPPPKITVSGTTPSTAPTLQDDILTSIERQAPFLPPEDGIPTAQQSVPPASIPSDLPQATRQPSLAPSVLPFRQHTPMAPDTRFGTNVPHTAGNPDPLYRQLPPAEIRPEEPDVKLIKEFIKIYQESKKYAGDPYDLLGDKINIMLVIRPLYGLAEAGLFWFFTYHSHHLDALKMNISIFNLCLLVTDPNRAEKSNFGKDDLYERGHDPG